MSGTDGREYLDWLRAWARRAVLARGRRDPSDLPRREWPSPRPADPPCPRVSRFVQARRGIPTPRPIESPTPRPSDRPTDLATVLVFTSFAAGMAGNVVLAMVAASIGVVSEATAAGLWCAWCVSSGFACVAATQHLDRIATARRRRSRP